MLFTLDTVFLLEGPQRESQAGEGGGRLARALRSSGEQVGGLGPVRGVGRVLSFFALEPPSLILLRPISDGPGDLK